MAFELVSVNGNGEPYDWLADSLADLAKEGTAPVIVIGVGAGKFIFHSRDDLSRRQLKNLLLQALAVLKTERAVPL